MHLSRSSDGVRRCPWALNMSPWAYWNARTDLKWKYSLTVKWNTKSHFFYTKFLIVGTNFLTVHFSTLLTWIFQRSRCIFCLGSGHWQIWTSFVWTFEIWGQIAISLEKIPPCFATKKFSFLADTHENIKLIFSLVSIVDHIESVFQDGQPVAGGEGGNDDYV